MCAINERDLDKSLLCICACVLKSINVKTVSSGFIETLAEILKVFISETGKESRRLSEHANRQGIIADDILASLISLGFNVTSLPQYYQDMQQKCMTSGGHIITLTAPETEQQTSDPNRLKIGSQIDKPPFIPAYMLPLPEAHTFTETRTFSRVNDNYKNSRENYSEQSRNSDTALISIHLNSFSTNANMTGLLKNQTLFHSDPNQFQLLAPEERSNLQSFHAVLEQSEIPEVPSARYDPRHGPSIYKNKEEDNTQLEGSQFDKHYRTKDDVEVKFTDRRIDRLKNPTSADVYHYKYYQSRRFARDVYARHGMASGVDPSICFPDKRELKKIQKLLQQERSVSEMLTEIKAERAEFEKQKFERDKKLKSTIDKMPEMVRDWMETERNERERAELLRRKRKEYSERIRQHYGATVAPNSAEHNRILEILLEEDLNRQKGIDPDKKKKQKLAKKKAKQLEAEDKLKLSRGVKSDKESESSKNDSSNQEVGPDLNDSVLSDKILLEEGKA